MFKSRLPALLVLVLAVILAWVLGEGPRVPQEKGAIPAVGPNAIPNAAVDPSSGAASDSKPVASRNLGKAAEETSASMDEMIGQMIMVGFKGRSARQDGVEEIRERLDEGLLGGVMLLGRNVESRPQLRALTRSLKDSGAPLEPFISVDQEGGAVQRLDERRGFREIPSARRIARTQSPQQAGVTFGVLAEQLADVGVNLNFGPVVDLNLNPQNPVIGRLGRSFGTRPDRVAEYARWFIVAHQAHDVFTAPKHFPGHGSSRTDSHEGFTDISETWREVELEPFRKLIRRDGDVRMVMVGHLFHPRFSDGDEVPASLSSRAIEHWLREELEFKGVVITDDLNMGAIEDRYSLKETTIRAVKAGNDILLFSNYPDYDPDLAENVHRIIAEAVESGEIAEDRIAASYRRIKRMKASD